jgi:hypothetical protein
MFSGTLVIIYKTIRNNETDDHIPSPRTGVKNLKVLSVYLTVPLY